MINKNNEKLIREAVTDYSLSDEAFRQVIYSILNPAELTEEDIAWANEVLKNKVRSV